MTARILTGDAASWRARRTGAKWGHYPADVLPLWVAEMDAEPCAPIVDAVARAMERGDTGYGLGENFIAAGAAYAADTWSWTIDPSLVLPVADVMAGVSEWIRLSTDAGGPVVLSSPVYNAFFGHIDMVGRRTVDAPLDAQGRLDLETLDRAFGEVTAGGERAAYLLCNPHNPTGTVHTATELTGLAEVAQRHGVQVISDEIHAPIVHEGAFTPYLTVPGGERGVALHSTSKAWNLAGFKSALAIRGADAPESLRLHEMMLHGCSHLGEVVSVAAWTHGRGWLAQMTSEVGENRALLSRLLADHLPQVAYAAPAATYLAWLDFRSVRVADGSTGLGDDPAAHLNKHARVALSAGHTFGDQGRGWARLNLATSPTILTEAVERMAGALA